MKRCIYAIKPHRSVIPCTRAASLPLTLCREGLLSLVRGRAYSPLRSMESLQRKRLARPYIILVLEILRSKICCAKKRLLESYQSKISPVGATIGRPHRPRLSM